MHLRETARGAVEGELSGGEAAKRKRKRQAAVFTEKQRQEQSGAVKNLHFLQPRNQKRNMKMKIIARYALRNPKINTKCKIEPKGIIFCLEQTATGSATAVAARTEGFLADKPYHYICGEGIVYAIAQPTRFAAHSNGSADKNTIGIALVLPSPEARDEKSEFAKYRRSEAAIRTENVVKTAVLLAANLCRRFGLDPKADGVILTRKEAAQRGLAENGASPESVFETLGGKMSAKKLREQISKLLAG